MYTIVFAEAIKQVNWKYVEVSCCSTLNACIVQDCSTAPQQDPNEG
jgi:hypothetical protein